MPPNFKPPINPTPAEKIILNAQKDLDDLGCRNYSLIVGDPDTLLIYFRYAPVNPQWALGACEQLQVIIKEKWKKDGTIR